MAFKKWFKERESGDINDNTKIALTALLTTLFILLDRIPFFRSGGALGAWIGFGGNLVPSVIALMIAGYVMGWRWAMLVGGIGNMIGSLMFPSPAGWWFEITLTWMIVGGIMGFLLFRKRTNTCRKLLIFMVIAITINIAIDIFVRQLFPTVRMDAPYWVGIGARSVPFIVLNSFVFAIVFPLVLSIGKPVERFLVSDKDENGDDETDEAL